MRDEVYAEEAAARRVPGGLVMADEARGLTVAGWAAHQARGRQLAPGGLVDAVSTLAARTRLRPVTAAVLAGYDRLTRGWTDRDVWNLDWSLARRAGEQLYALADGAHGWPDGHYATFEDWQDALRTAGGALLAYAAEDRVDALTDAWWDMPEGPDRDAARDAVTAREEELAERATQAWAWVAANHRLLCD